MAIVQCFNAPKASAFDYNLLEPLQKLLRLSSPVASSLARADLFTGILQKLNHKKAVVRLNLLRIVRSISDPSQANGDNIRDHDLFEAIQRLAEQDTAVLVRNMASELVKSNLEQDNETSSGGRSRPGYSSRRKNSYTPPSLQKSVSTPMTPTQPTRGSSSSSAFIDGSVTPRRMALPSSTGEALIYRPRSRDGPPPGIRKTSSELGSSSAASKSRLPRTSMLRTSRSSVTASSNSRDEASMLIGRMPTSSARDIGVRLRDQARASGSASGSASPAAQQGGIAPQLNPKRRARAPSGDIKWS